MSELVITHRYPRALSADGTRPDDAPNWIDDIDNPYLHGFYAPIQTEYTVDELEIVEGAIPQDLCGAYFRNGPNQIYKPKNRYHWFDGDGMIYGIWFKDGKASFKNRWIRTEAYAMEQEAKQAIWPGVLGPFDFSLPISPIKDTANTDLVFFNRSLIALWYESGKPYMLDPLTLETKGVETLSGQLTWPVSAHAHHDAITGELIFFNSGHKPPYMQYGVINKQGEIHKTDIDLPGPRRPHDIGITQDYSILHDFPIFYNEEQFKKTGKRLPLFHPEVATRFGVIPRYGRNEDVRWFECQPCYMLHVVNSWEDGDWIVMVGCITKDPTFKPEPEDGDIGSMLSFLKLRANLYEWRFNLKTGEVIEGDLDGLNAEFPMINENFRGLKNRFAYLQDIPYKIPALFEGLIKYDIGNGTLLAQWQYGPGIYGSEAPFAAKTGATGEDDGYVLTMVTDTNDWSSYCLVFDAKNINQGPMTKLRLPQRMPCGFHTRWVAGEEIFD